MGSAIACGLAGKEVFKGNITVSDASLPKLEELQKGLPGISICRGNVEACKCADVIILAVKPFMIKNVIEEIRDSLDILPLSYIAKHYFGKSASWLYQRINGNKVRGKVYTLNKEEIEIFNKAFKTENLAGCLAALISPLYVSTSFPGRLRYSIWMNSSFSPSYTILHDFR